MCEQIGLVLYAMLKRMAAKSYFVSDIVQTLNLSDAMLQKNRKKLKHLYVMWQIVDKPIWCLCGSQPTVRSIGLFSTSNTITFDQSWRHLHSNSAGGKGLSNDFQTRLIRSMVQWVKSSRRVSFDYIWLIHVRPDDFFSESFALKASPVEDQSLQQKDE